METIRRLLGQEIIAAELIERLCTSNRRVWLEGPSGSGKSSIGDHLLRSYAPPDAAIRLSGDAAYAQTPYLALYRALEGTRLRKRVREAASDGIIAPLKAVPVIGGAVTDLAKLAIAGLRRAAPEFLTSEQEDLLQGLQGIAGSGRFVIVVDDAQWLDNDTATLLALLWSPEVQKAYSFAGATSLLLIENLDARHAVDPPSISALRSDDVIRVARPARASFPAVLNAFGLSHRLPETLLDGLYAVSGGHLEIARQIVRTAEITDLEQLLGEGDTTSLMAALLSRRVDEAAEPALLMRLLRISACAGTAFSRAELRCAFADDDGFAAALTIACREQLLSVDGDFLRFFHELVRAAAEQITGHDAQGLHRKLEECVRLLRPGDYGTRLRHARLANDLEKAEEFAFVIAMAAVRGERVPLVGAWSMGRLAAELEDARLAYRLTDQGDHRGAVSTMMRYYDGTQALAQGEIVSLIALNQIKLCTEDSYNEAAGLLEHWVHQRSEPEIWQRLMSMLIAAWVLCGQEEQATELYAKLAHDLALQSRHDPAARTRLEALNRKADMVFTSEIAVKHIQRAVDWFGPGEAAAAPRNAFEYTASLVNLSGALHTLGRYMEGARAAAEALLWSDRLRLNGIRVIEPYKALNNYVICSFRSGIEDATAAGDALQLLLSHERHPLRRDRSLMAINRASFALLAGDLAGGRDLLERVWKHISNDDLDAYYILYCGSNLAVAKALFGERAEAERLLASLSSYLETVPKWYRSGYRRRHNAMLEAVADPVVTTAQAMDEYPFSRRLPDGVQDSWWSLGRGLLMSDIQAWAEA